MNVIIGNLDEKKVNDDEVLDLSKCTYIFIQNNGEVAAFVGGRKIGAGKEIEINLQFVIKQQELNIRFENGVGSKDLYIMLGKAITTCSN